MTYKHSYREKAGSGGDGDWWGAVINIPHSFFPPVLPALLVPSAGHTQLEVRGPGSPLVQFTQISLLGTEQDGKGQEGP